ncbi:MAG TPA: 3-dehydroquinate synthase [Gemmatimonadaceae bacterium]|nr:3-dehydroquinate synthase [Gemmatimonadaceae bacterium]
MTDIRLPSYRVHVALGALDEVGASVRQAAAAYRYVIVTDTNVGPRYASRIREQLGPDVTRTITIPDGEAYKTRDTWAAITDEMLDTGCGRDTTVIALGGGVIGDLAGFVAATFMRGVPFVQVPTSLLAMLDASVGGKTGVDTRAGKNLVGAFHQPAAVLIDPLVLRTLAPRHLRAGFAEAIKHGVIAEAAHFDAVAGVAAALGTGEPDTRALAAMIARSVEIKAAVVAADEREQGRRKTLNFGHTIGHAIEHLSDYALLHGEAVAIGICVEAAIAERLGVAEAGTAARIREACARAGLPVARPASLAAADILQLTHGDKKGRGGRAEYALPARIGAMAFAERGWSAPVDDAVVMDALA